MLHAVVDYYTHMKHFLRLFLLGISALLPLFANARTWTRHDGNTCEASLESIGEHSIFIRLDSNYMRYEIMIADLSEEDQAYVAEKKAANSEDKEEAPKETAMGEVPKYLKKVQNLLVDANGKRVSGDDLGAYDYVMVYFSAHWCPPCKKFTPKLVEFYDSKKNATNFEIIFVSNDNSEDAMQEYMEEFGMKWPAVKFSRKDDCGLNEYAGSGIPCLVLLDKEGNVLAHSYEDGKFVGPTSVMNKLKKLL